MIESYNKEHEELKKSILNFALNCSDYLSISEAFMLPYQYRVNLIKMIKERYDKQKGR